MSTQTADGIDVIGDLVWRKEEAERRLASEAAARDEQRRQRQETIDRTQASRAGWRSRQELLHARELEVADLRHRRDTLCTRLQEDYQIDLVQGYQQATTGETPPAFLVNPIDAEPAQEEIAELRRKLTRLGSVNMESLQELTDLEARASALQVQFDDLTAAQKTLQDIINKANADSQRLFAETFATVREHFRELFRKLFGGGMADVVLEDETDILECGIDIVARPPGKELRSISLMSGGEKTMTAVALLLAIFRSKPSPFCILDEVDAALDEANVGRFTGVLREFLERSQFILITHSKRTMSCADVLYGVTMQESGVSKRMAVRFEEWPGEEGAGGVMGWSWGQTSQSAQVFRADREVCPLPKSRGTCLTWCINKVELSSLHKAFVLFQVMLPLVRRGDRPCPPS